MITVGRANTISRASAGCTETSKASVTPNRRIQPAVEKTDMYMWSSTNTWLRSIASRSRYSGRSWWPMVVMPACSRATCASSAIVTRSRNRRWMRVLTVRRNQVPTADRPSTTTQSRTREASPAATASAMSLNQ